jgi:hypothetical protein
MSAACALLAVLLVLPVAAKAQFSLDVTQVGQAAVGQAAQEDYPAHTGTCAKDACRATLPVQISGDWCVLNVRVGAPDRGGNGQVLFALGPCRSTLPRAIPGDAALASYHLDRIGAASLVLPIISRPTQWDGVIGLDDGVVRPDASVRLDIIATDTR